MAMNGRARNDRRRSSEGLGPLSRQVNRVSFLVIDIKKNACKNAPFFRAFSEDIAEHGKAQ
jgi:hypothetical protein